jgi:hypothetical protein
MQSALQDYQFFRATRPDEKFSGEDTNEKWKLLNAQ